jgi:hypothetical protein
VAKLKLLGPSNGGTGEAPSEFWRSLCADLNKLQIDFTRFEAIATTKDDLHKVQADILEIKVGLTGVDGRLSGISDRFASLPTVWTMLGIVFTTWALGSGILIFAMNYLRR